jgi:O-Antigen ligase
VTDAAIQQPRVSVGAAAEASSRSAAAVLLLQLFALAVMMIPSDTVIEAIGAAGYPASLIGVLIFFVFSASWLLGVQDRARPRHPIQVVLCVLWLSVLASYVLMDRAVLTGAELASADRLLIRVAVITGVALVAAEWLRSLEDVRSVLRWLCWGGAFCGVVAALQYWVGLDLAQYLRDLPGFTLNQDNPAIADRGSVSRVAGTAITPIELGVVAGMLLPIAIYLGLYDREPTALKRWAPAALIVVAVSASVSRSAVVSVVVAFVVLAVLLPPKPRLAALSAAPFAVIGVFMLAPGLIGTLASFFTAGGSDPSIQYRTHDYPLAEELWRQAPWFGHGGGTYINVDSVRIFDNQFLLGAVELGLFGLFALGVFFFVPFITALVARRRSGDPELRVLCAALAGAGLAGAICSFTFDSLSFPMFVNVYALVIGLIGACWRLGASERDRKRGSPRTVTSPRALSTGG